MQKKFLYVRDKAVRKLSTDEFEDCITEYPEEIKKKVLVYFKAFPACAFTSEPVRDKYSGEIVYDADNGRSDGTYMWYESEIYHFEKYNIKLNDDFIEYVLNRS